MVGEVREAEESCNGMNRMFRCVLVIGSAVCFKLSTKKGLIKADASGESNHVKQTLVLLHFSCALHTQ